MERSGLLITTMFALTFAAPQALELRESRAKANPQRQSFKRSLVSK
jgi:hypothetical protein